METSLKTGFAQILSCCPKNVSCPKFRGGAPAPLPHPFRLPPPPLPPILGPHAYVSIYKSNLADIF